MLEGTPTKRPRLLGREKQTPKTGAHGHRKEDAEKKTDTRSKRTRAQFLSFFFVFFSPRDVLERKSEKTKIAWPKNAQPKML